VVPEKEEKLMQDEKLFVDKSEVQHLWKMADEWEEQGDGYTVNVGTGIRFALIALELDKEAKS
jgi:hypothetical protein